jgi:hypothetical protein
VIVCVDIGGIVDRHYLALSLEVIVCVDIGGIVDRHYLALSLG